jgi:putative ABC transport system substrate-binding protein
MQRRDFITILGGAAATWPIVARAQQPTVPVIGFLTTRSANDSTANVAAFRQGLAQTGYVEGGNVAIEYRWADSHYDQLPGLVAELVRHPVATIAVGGTPASLAAKAATTTIPIVFEVGVDPVKVSLVASLARPGGNVTGVSFFFNVLASKQVEMLHELVRTATTIGFLANPNFPTTEADTRDVQAAARALGQKAIVIKASSVSDFNPAFTTMVQERIGALLVQSDPLFNGHPEQLAALAARHALPTVYPLREFTEAGGLLSYGSSMTDAWRKVGIYTGMILKGEKPAEMPVQQAVKVELVINLKTAKALGITIPPTLLAQADEVIE